MKLRVKILLTVFFTLFISVGIGFAQSQATSIKTLLAAYATFTASLDSNGDQKINLHDIAISILPSSSASVLPVASPTAGLFAFPGAEGYGANTVGGRGGQVIQVTNLSDNGNNAAPTTGSLRACTAASGSRTCVFRVSGRIELAAPLTISNPFITIAGQTAPGNGITLSAGPNISRGIVIIQTNDVIIRYVGLRPGLHVNQVLVESEYNIDSLTIGDLNKEPYNVIIDHVSMAWATDEILNTARKHHGITVQWSIMSEVNDCDGDPANNRCGGKGPLFHTGTADQRGGGDISFHHNLLSSNQGRNPMIKNAGGVNDIVNNVIFPTTRDGTAITAILDDTHADATHGNVRVNFVGNYLIGDPVYLNNSANRDQYIRLMGMRMACPRTPLGYDYTVYVQDNIGPMRPDDSCTGMGLTQKQCELLIINPVHVNQSGCPSFVQRGDQNLHLDSQGNLLRIPAPLVSTHSAVDAYNRIVSVGGVGKSARLDSSGNWVSYRDSVDTKIIDDVIARRTQQISGQPWPASVSDWPAGTITPSYSDTDGDGMSDAWEQAQFGNLSRGSAANSSSDFDADGYTDLEEFLNGTDPKVDN